MAGMGIPSSVRAMSEEPDVGYGGHHGVRGPLHGDLLDLARKTNRASAPAYDSAFVSALTPHNRGGTGPPSLCVVGLCPSCGRTMVSATHPCNARKLGVCGRCYTWPGEKIDHSEWVAKRRAR